MSPFVNTNTISIANWRKSLLKKRERVFDLFSYMDFLELVYVFNVEVNLVETVLTAT